MLTPSFRSFTVKARGGVLRALVTKCLVADANPPAGQPVTFHEFEAIWDTGATNSIITNSVVATCGIRPTGMIKTQGVHGSKDSETYVVNIGLPNGLRIDGVKVARGELDPNTKIGVLLGMDIITLGDFAVTNVGGVTIFTFRHPSITTIDYVDEANDLRAHAQRVANKKQRKANKHRKPFHG